MTSSDNKRIACIDFAKIIGIYCVVLAHTQLDKQLQNWIYVFHMPLFFFISGFLFSYGRNKSFGSFVRKRLRQLMLPYAVINILTYVFWLFVGRHVGADSNSDIPIWQPIVGAVFCYGDLMIHNIPLWFLQCLFIIEVVYYRMFTSNSARTRWILIGGWAIVGCINYMFNPIRLPFSIGTVMTGIVFYAIGNEVRKLHLEANNILWAVAAIALVTIIALANGRINMHKNYYGNFAMFVSGGLAGIYMMMWVSRLLAQWTRRLHIQNVIAYISDNTLYICGFHLMCLAFVKGILVYVFKADISMLTDTIVPNILFSIAGMAVCVGAIYLCQRLYRRFVSRPNA